VIGLTKALAKEVATKGILVHAVAPVVTTGAVHDLSGGRAPY
jgi:NAD(P)-dependent dehydrogenase (short-subunit alcohol dehydrogenase family)